MRIDVTRKQLIQRGWLRADSRRGIWELGAAGVERLRRAKHARGQRGLAASAKAGGGAQMILSALGTAILAVLGLWLFGGLLARIASALLVLAGAVGLATVGDANGFLLVALGAVMWWAGQLHYAARHGTWKSVLAERLFAAPGAAWHRLGRREGAPPPDADLRALPGGAASCGEE